MSCAKPAASIYWSATTTIRQTLYSICTEVDLVIGGSAERDAVQVLRLAPSYTEQQVLEQVRALLDPPLTFSATS